MRKILALLALSLSASSFAQMLSRDQLIGEALKDFGNVSGGLYLEQQCHALSEGDAGAFSENVSLIQTALAVDLGGSAILEKIQASAKNVATSEKYKSCNQDIHNIIKQTSAHASNWSSQIKQIQSGTK